MSHDGRVSDKPRVFIASSTESLGLARAVEDELVQECEVEVWDQTVFLPKLIPPSGPMAPAPYDYAVVVMTAADVVTSRGETQWAPRDNLVFELGLFMGMLGRDHVFVVKRCDEEFKLPSDLAGVEPIDIGGGSDDEVHRSLRQACQRLRGAMGVLTLSSPEPDASANGSAPG